MVSRPALPALRLLPRKAHPAAVFATAAIAAGAVVLGPTRDARADDVSPTGKGIVGGGLLGAEVVTMIEAIAGARPGWAYAVGAIVGAGGGAVGGYFVEQGSSDGKAPMYMLAGGLALVIPAVVLTLNATRYMPEEGSSEDAAPTGPAAEPGVPGGSVGASAPAAAPPPPPAAASPAPPPQSMLDFSPKAIRIGLPAPEVRPVFTLVEQRQYGLQSATELRLPVVHVAF
jgi:hypothetical protein